MMTLQATSFLISRTRSVPSRMERNPMAVALYKTSRTLSNLLHLALPGSLTQTLEMVVQL